MDMAPKVNSDESRNRVIKELVIITILTNIVFILAIFTNFFERIIEWSLEHKSLFVNEIIITLVAMSIMLAIFSFRRWRELNYEVIERKKMERKLHQNRMQLQAVLDGVPDIIVQVDNHLRIIWANKAALDKNKNSIGQLCNVAFPDIEGLSIETYCRWAMETKKIERGIRYQPAREGINSDRYWEGIGVPLMLNDGRVIGAVAVARNVTDHMQVEATRKLLASIVESSDDAIIGESLNGKIYSWNRGAEKIFGYKSFEVTGKSLPMVVAPEFQHNIPFLREKVKRGEKVENYQVECITKDNRRIHTSITVSPIMQATGNIIGISAIARDITAQKLAEEALKQSEERYRNLFEHSLEGIAITKGTKFVTANEALLNIFGYESLEDFLNVSLLDNVTPESREELIDKFSQMEMGDADEQMYEIKIVRKDGEIRDVEVSSGALELGDEIFFQSTFRDITERKKAEKELRNSQEQLRRLATHLESVREEERKQIAFEIHDELGQALTALKMDLAWIGKKMEKKESIIMNRMEGMSELIDFTIDKVRTISTQLRPSILDHFGLPAAIEWQVEEFQKRTDISCNLEIDPTLQIEDDNISTGLFRIFQETLTNISRHSRATEVDISLTDSYNSVVLKVKDNGIGIRSSQIDNPNSFGLIGIRERAYIAGGKAIIEGVEGKGTTITVMIPLLNNGVLK